MDVAEGVIFNNWKLGEFNNELEYGYGLDFGFSPDPTAMTKIAVDKTNKKIYLHEEVYKTELLTADLISSILPTTKNKVVIADNSANRLIMELSRAGVNILPCVKGAGSIEEGIKLMSEYEIIVTPSSINIVKELNNYIWSNKKAGAPIDMYNHAIDGIRYYCSHILKVGNSPLISF
jgi:phage terminase large subunit